jgi:hypothetical protein
MWLLSLLVLLPWQAAADAHAAPTLYDTLHQQSTTMHMTQQQQQQQQEEVCAMQAEDGSCLVYATTTTTMEPHKQQPARNDNDDESALLQPPPDACEDTREECPGWATIGECDKNPGFMKYYCPVSCKTCPSLPYDHSTRYGEPQTVFMEHIETMEPLLQEMDTYMHQTVYVDPEYDAIKISVCRVFLFNMDYGFHFYIFSLTALFLTGSVLIVINCAFSGL